MQKSGGRPSKRLRSSSYCVLAVACGLFAVACAPKQIVPIAAEPRPLEIFLDQKMLPAGSEAVELRADRDHTLFFKREGYRSDLIVLQSREVDGEPRLLPDRVDVLLREELDTTPSLELEFDESPADAGSQPD